TPQQLVQNVLVGNGVATSNITFTGVPNAIGSFDGTACNVGLDSGIILTSGTVLNTMQFGVLEGPFGPNDQSGAGVDNNQPGDPLLAAATGNLSFNAARLEFDFIPQSDSLKFNFVFGSEEYLEFVNAGVNDAFGFFISGPNPLGGNYTDENISIVPGTNLPVTIDNLNSTQNAAYYIDNGDGFSAPQNASPTYVQYDGLTTVLEAKASVVCGQSYHIIIVISDIGDGILDSGVFLEAGSFSSPGIDLSSELSFQTTIGNDSTLVEGCGGAHLWFVRNDSLAFTQTIDVT
ncbi:choice-of-anchor L domain-containing protein, partial [Crocinitomicaceae bacterium]|nr:choice-of-anchor L domain-containing protein [Crocinitomicaceae bacterium]